jgi:hypothetical protein
LTEQWSDGIKYFCCFCGYVKDPWTTQSQRNMIEPMLLSFHWGKDDRWVIIWVDYETCSVLDTSDESVRVKSSDSLEDVTTV